MSCVSASCPVSVWSNGSPQIRPIGHHDHHHRGSLDRPDDRFGVVGTHEDVPGRDPAGQLSRLQRMHNRLRQHSITRRVADENLGPHDRSPLYPADSDLQQRYSTRRLHRKDRTVVRMYS